MSKRAIRLLSANLRNGCGDAAQLAQWLRELKVDVALVQELGPKQAAALAEVLPHGKLEPGTDFNGMGIALRWPGEVRRLPLRHRDARVAELEPAEWPALVEGLEIVNVHIQSPHHPRPWVAFGRRRAQVQGLTDYLVSVPRPRRVVAGDLNATPLWPAYRRLVAHLPDAVAAHRQRRGARASRTWGPWPGAPRLLRIDHVLARGLAVVHAERLEIRGSDHSAILVDLVPEAEERGEPGALARRTTPPLPTR